jgi:hypothetical protein
MEFDLRQAADRDPTDPEQSFWTFAFIGSSFGSVKRLELQRAGGCGMGILAELFLVFS